jgi:hypothetical protein
MSNTSNTTKHAQVKSPLGKKKMSVSESLTALDAVGNAGSACAEVQASPVAAGALTALIAAVGAAKKSLARKLDLLAQLKAAMKDLSVDFGKVRVATRTYQSAVEGVALGSAQIINKAGLEARTVTVSQGVLERVSVLHSKPGKHPTEAILTWPKAAGATSYAIEVNLAPNSATPTWVALTPGTGRRRVVKASAPGGQLLARVAALGTGGAQSDWCTPLLVQTAF